LGLEEEKEAEKGGSQSNKRRTCANSSAFGKMSQSICGKERNCKLREHVNVIEGEELSSTTHNPETEGREILKERGSRVRQKEKGDVFSKGKIKEIGCRERNLLDMAGNTKGYLERGLETGENDQSGETGGDSQEKKVTVFGRKGKVLIQVFLKGKSPFSQCLIIMDIGKASIK